MVVLVMMLVFVAKVPLAKGVVGSLADSLLVSLETSK